MTPNEFKAWFDGFTEAFDDKIPTKAQWTRIRERVAEIDGRPITERVFVDRWYPYIQQHWPYWSHTTWGGTTIPCTGGAIPNQNTAFDGHTAMHALGKADSVSLSSA